VNSDEIRRTFLSFFEERGHRILPSASLIPDDPTLLLTIAGMVPFKPYFLGQATPDYPRAASVQKCARTIDIEQVGHTARHLTFFEMLGNFSFGDYFKKDACAWAWELVTGPYGLDPERLWVTIFETDDEAFEVWRDHVRVPAERIIRRGREDNFWGIVPGPCGPCSEIFYDRGPKYGPDTDGFVDGDRIMEIWNLVFMQSIQDEDERIVGDLPSKNIDTGAGIERLAMALQDVEDAFHTDVLRRILETAESVTGHRFDHDEKTDMSLRVIADHVRAATFLIGDGIFPSNEERGYVLRRLIRRAIRHARILGTEAPIMERMIGSVIDAMGTAYPDIETGKAFIVQTAAQEEEHFQRTLRQGLSMLEEEVKRATVGKDERLAGEIAFKLHDTYGFPIDLTVEIANEAGIEVDRIAFEHLMQEQRRRAREARTPAEEVLRSHDAVQAVHRAHAEYGATDFVGYETTSSDARILALITKGRPVEAAGEGTDVEVMLDRTPFYAEGGGQVGDSGTITIDGATIEVSDTQWILGDVIMHTGRVAHGEARVGADAHAEVDVVRRAAIMRSHSATHVVHWELRHLLGPHARQAGSLVEAGRLRFDFPHTSSVPRDVLQQAEEEVNRLLLSDSLVRAYETTMEYARSIGAMALFGEKYGDIVRVVEIGDYSVELCGGTHVHHTAQVGPVKILGESSIGANLRRIEALTGTEAIEGFRRDRALLERIAALVNASPAEAPDKVARMLDDLKAAARELERTRGAQTRDQAATLVASAERVGDTSLVVADVPGTDVGALQKLAVAVRDAAPAPAAIVLGSASDGKAGIVAAVTKDLASRGVSAKSLIAQAARAIGGGAGGKDEVATGGGSKPAGLADALRLASEEARRALGA